MGVRAPPGPARRRHGPPRAAPGRGRPLLAFGAWAGTSACGPQPPRHLRRSCRPRRSRGRRSPSPARRSAPTRETMVVRFGDRRGPVTSATDTSIAATVPAELAKAPPGDIRVVVEVDGRSSNALFMTLARYPRVTGVAPGSRCPATRWWSTGANLDAAGAAVRIGGFAAELSEAGPTRCGSRCPTSRWSTARAWRWRSAWAARRRGRGPSSSGRLPLVTGIPPQSGEAGTTVTISGLRLPVRRRTRIRVTFGARDALVLAATDREVKAVRPRAAGSCASQQALPRGGRGRGDAVRAAVISPPPGPRATCSARVSSPCPPPAAIARATRWWAPSSAPCSLLTGRGGRRLPRRTRDARGRGPERPHAGGERAAPVRIEAPAAPRSPPGACRHRHRDRGGCGDALPRLRPAPPARGSRAPALARYWAALLHDYVGLFGQRQRPNRIVEMTPRARVLLDLYADAERRGGSSGVATRLVADMPAAGARKRCGSSPTPRPAEARGRPRPRRVRRVGGHGRGRRARRGDPPRGPRRGRSRSRAR